MKKYILDACALIVYLRKEDGYEKACDLLKNTTNSILMHAINFGEVYYDTLRVSGKQKADELFQDIIQLPITIIWNMDEEIIKISGKYKAKYKIAYADCYALALAEIENAILVSTDHTELDKINSEKKISIYWLRPKKIKN